MGRGVRVYNKAPHELCAGEYGKWEPDGDGAWYAVPPGTDLVANLSAHNVEEHQDGPITVSPSILVSAGRESSWHGYLRASVFEEC